MKPNSWMVAALLIVPAAQAAPSNPSGFDAFLESQASLKVPVPTRPLAKLATVAHVEQRLGVPTFVWGSAPSPRAAALLGNLEGLRPEQAARRHLFELAELYRLRPEEVVAAPVRAVHDTGFGGIIVTFRQSAEGIEIFRKEISVLMDRKLQLVALSGHFSPDALAHKGWAERFALTASTAATVALQDLTGAAVDPGAFIVGEGGAGGYSRLQLPPSVRAGLELAPLIPLRTKPVLFELAEGLEPGFYVELKVGDGRRTDSRYFSYVVSAVDGRVLFRNNLTRDAFSYRAWADNTGSFVPFDGPHGNDASPHPTGLPDGYQAPFVAPNLITLDHAGLSTNDPWLSPSATSTRGNNVDAYADLASPDGFGAGDLRADLSSANTFDYTYDVTAAPGASDTQRKASVVEIFYLNNFLHDWYYDSGFNEVSGNGQSSNYGRGGLENDCILAEGQDFSGRDNANMQIPADGAHPIMQMYVFTGNGTRELAVTSPPAVAGSKYFRPADFGPTSFNVTADLVRVDDGVAPNADGCQALVNGPALVGKVAYLERGTCTFTEKVAAVQAAGAVGAIIANNQGGGPMPLYGSDPGITIPAVSVSQNTGTPLVAQLTAGTPVTVRMTSNAGVDRDGTQDNEIMAHEWGHYISSRLVGNANGLMNGQGEGLGEGWSDFHSLLMVVNPQDAQVNSKWSGVYGLATYTSSGAGNNGFYFGIRRVPYSTDLTKDPLTYKHIQDGVALPTSAPIAFGANGASNSESHATGEVWATMLWECYAALLRDDSRLSFAQAQQRMKAYLVASYKVTPSSPTILEARDAVLAAALAADPVDFAAFAQAFAKRGAGVGASGPDRSSRDNVGVVESFVSGGDLRLVSATLDDAGGSCDGDGILDNTETGELVVTLKNIGTSDLSATTAQVSSPNPAIGFPQGASLVFSASKPFAVMTAKLQVRLQGMVGSQRTPIDIAFTDPGMAAPRVLTSTLLWRMNYDDLPSAAATDDVESLTTRWTISHDVRYYNSAPFRRVDDPSSARWFGPNPSSPEDQSLTSPPLKVSETSKLVISFLHRYSFESDASNYFDGAVVEVRKNGGAWVDVANSISPAYPVKLNEGTTMYGRFFPSANPLRGRWAFGAKSPGYPAFTNATIDLGTTYAGSQIELRFRMGGDEGGAEVGWDIDDISIQGVDNKPFNKVVPGHASCGNAVPIVLSGAELTVEERSEVSIVPIVSDGDNDPLTFAWTQTAGPALSIKWDGPSLSFPAPEVTQDVSFAFDLVVSDGWGSTAPATFKVLVKNVNRKPVAVVGSDQAVDERSEVTLSAEGSSDADGDPLTYEWTQVDGPAVVLTGADTAAPSFTAPDVEADSALTFSLVVSDGSLGSDPTPVTVTVADVFKSPKTFNPLGLVGCGCGAGASATSLLPFALGLVLATLGRRRVRRSGHEERTTRSGAGVGPG